ncbi:hypothetical protein MAR_032840 [Mya arenaria]|uniref:Uncharacterized protein n=1 Tax=Mya arenaria TaxID=6604 RepID=A0ABY7G7B6_MYAAR|nr:hypothetical protein MAR_032840 [Mya arenaria]
MQFKLKMRSYYTLFTSAFLVTMATGCPDISTVLKRRPTVMSNFNETLWMGQWFKQRWSPPCSWSGSRKFSDQAMNNEYTDQPEIILGHAAWRMNGHCVQATEHLLKEKVPGIYRVVDPIGDVLTGEGRVVATDYTGYNIFWGCTRPDIVDPLLCDDPWMSVTTRNAHPDPKCINHAADALKSIFDIPINAILQHVYAGRRRRFLILLRRRPRNGIKGWRNCTV